MATVTVKDKKDLKESRKVSSDIGRAFLNKTSKKSKNSHTDGKSLYLHGHEIAKHGENGAVHGTMAGWPTKTTKDRLNAISNDRFHTKKGKHYYGDKEIGERDWVQIKEAIRIMVEGAIKDLETKDEEEKRLLKTDKPKKILTDKERGQSKALRKKDLKEAKKLYVRKVQGDSRTRRNKKAWDLAFNPKKPVSFFDELKAINAKKEQEKKDLKEGVLSALKNRLTGRRSKVKSDLENKSNDYSNKRFVSSLKAYVGLRVADKMFSPKESKPGVSTPAGVKKIRTAAYKEYDKSLKYRKLEASAKHKAENLSKTKNYFTGKGRVNESAMLKALGQRVKANLKADARDAKEAILKAGPKIGAAAEKGLVGLGKAGEKVVKKTIYPTMYKHLQRVNEDDETASRYKKALADSKGSITKDGEELVKNRIKQLQKEGFTRTLDNVSGNQKRRIKKKLKHQNSMISTPLSKVATNNKRLQRLEK